MSNKQSDQSDSGGGNAPIKPPMKDNQQSGSEKDIKPPTVADTGDPEPPGETGT